MPGQPPRFDLASETTSTGKQWKLLRRPWGAGWFLPWIFIMVGIVVAAIFGINGPITLPNFSGDTFAAIFDLVWLLGDVVFSLAGLVLITLGLAFRYAQTTVTLSQVEITTTDRFGLLRWTRRLHTTHITGFEINVGTSSTNSGPSVPMENVTMLIAHTDLPAKFKNTKKKEHDFIIAWGYPKTWMQELADALTEDSEFINPMLADLETTTTFGSGDRGERSDAVGIPVDPPKDTNILLLREPDGLTINIPPKGIMRGSKGLAFFAILWNGFILLMLGMIVFTMLTPNNPNTSGPDSPWTLLFFLPFIAVGIGLAVFSVHAGKSQASLVIIGSGEAAVLAYIRNSPVLKTRELNWPANELSHLCIGDSNMPVNDVPIQELQVHPKQGKKVGLLAQFDDEELKWIAYELRQQLGVSKRAITQQP